MYYNLRAIVLDAVTPVQRIGLSAELGKLSGELPAANALRKIGIGRRVAEIIEQLQGKDDAPEVVEAQSSVEAKPAEITVWLTEQRLDMLKAKVKGFQRRAAKLGVNPVDMVETGNTRMRRLVFTPEQRGMGTSFPASMRAIPLEGKVPVGSQDAGVIKQIEVTITGELPQLAGWRFVATLEHAKVGNIVKAAPGGGEIPGRFLTAKSVCEHCGTSRNRNKTVVCKHEDGRYVQVGSNCLKDFLGHGDAEYLAQLAAWRSEFWDAAGDSGLDDELADYMGGGGRARHYIEVARFLPHVARSVRERGWISRASADERNTLSTADDAAYTYQPPKGIDPAKLEALPVPTDADREKAAAAVEWAKALADEQIAGNSFLNNMRVIANEEGVEWKNAGMAAALIIAYDKAMDTIKASAQKVPSEWRGEVGKRDTFKGLKLEAVIPLEGVYGVTYIHKFRAQDGALFVWRSSGVSWEDENGKTFDVTATVKKHGEYKGEKQTEIQRAKGELSQDSGDAAELRARLVEAARSADGVGAFLDAIEAIGGEKPSKEVFAMIARIIGFKFNTGSFWSDAEEHSPAWIEKARAVTDSVFDEEEWKC